MTTLSGRLPAANTHDASADIRGRVFVISVALIVLLAFALRVGLSDYSLWFDDYASLIFSDQPYARLWSMWMAREANPPLYYSLLRAWRSLGADSAVSLRLLSIIAGTAHIAVIGWICGRWHSRKAGVLAVLLLAVSTQHILATHMVRGYAFAMFGSAISLGGLLLWRDGGVGRVLGKLLFVVGALFACYVHTTMVVWVAVGPAAIVICDWSRFFPVHIGSNAGTWRSWRDLIAMMFAVLVGFSWWLWVLLNRPAEAGQNIAWIVDFTLPEIAFKFMQHGQLLTTARVDDVPIMLCGAVLMATLAMAGRQAWLVRYFAATVLLCPIVWWLCSLLQPIVTIRSVQWPMGILAGLTACGIAELRARAARVGAAAIAVSVLLINGGTHRQDFVMEDWDALIANAAAKPSTAVLVQHESMVAIVEAACGMRYPAKCPFKIVGLKSGMPLDFWARGLARAPLLDNELAIHNLSRYKIVYSVRHFAHDPLLALNYPLRKPRSDLKEPFVEGPFSGDSFRFDRKPDPRLGPPLPVQ